MKKLIATSVLCFLTAIVGFGQQEVTKKCGADHALEDAFQRHPELRESYLAHQLLQNSHHEVFDSEGKSNHLYTIPVVFHILHEYGTENISDAQVYDAMEVINREFNAADPDSVDVVADFVNLIGNGKIEFVLAAVDPWGNCTNGIEHIYSHETRVGDGASKLNQWNRSQYLNIWVSKVVGAPGAAAYAIKPAGTDGNAFYLDGIVSNPNYVGSIGTGSPGVESTLTHEIGHWLNLSHPWGDNNDPMVACGDDGVADTPETAGWSYCPLGNADNCNPGIQEDLQNYMDYAYCDRHFTPGQVNVMHIALNSVAGQRNNLWTQETLDATGVSGQTMPQTALTVPLCAPVADFSSNEFTTCVNSPINFTDASWNAKIDNWNWTFQDGIPASSTDQNPLNVQFTSPGYKTVTLTVSNAAGSSTETRTGYVYISPEWADFEGPSSIDLEGPSKNWFIVNNPENNHARFHLSEGTGYNGSTSYKLNNYKNVSGADPYTNDYFYFQRLGKNIDELITPSFDLRYTSNATMTFKYSYATNVVSGTQQDKLIVYVSKDCGVTWIPRLTIDGDDLVTGGYAANVDFEPTDNNQWGVSPNVDPFFTGEIIRFKFVFEAADNSSNLFIDDINLSGDVGLISNELSELDLNVYPNPTSNGNAINVKYNAQNEPVTFTLRNTQGQIISTEVVEQTNTSVEYTLKNTKNLPAAYYFLEVTSGDHSTTRKVVVL